MDAYNLIELNQYIREVVALNFRESLWVKAEIAQIRESRGQFYLDLVEKDENTDDIIAKASAVIWYKSYLFIKKKLGDLSGQILREGTQVQCKVKIDFHSIYGLKFVIEDIDPSYTFGQLELNRQNTIERLKKENLLGKNREKSLPAVIQRIAVISSVNAAGLQDFMQQLENNIYGFNFDTRLFNASVQGKNLEKEITSKLLEIKEQANQIDCVVIIRGGGSKLDLGGFDSYNIAKIAANYPIPILSGIGHDIDQNIIELVVHTPLKTPTAVANFILDNNLFFESKINALSISINRNSKALLQNHLLLINQYTDSIKYLSYQYLDFNKNKAERLFDNLNHLAKSFLNQSERQIEIMYNGIRSADPKTILGKGYSIVYKKGELVKSRKSLKEQDVLTTVFYDGEIVSRVIKTENNLK